VLPADGASLEDNAAAAAHQERRSKRCKRIILTIRCVPLAL
jgi:hypothetical protein